ncbi:disintegrin and metalloproteinase domain-containing protein 21-like [Ciona intestinalis]
MLWPSAQCNKGLCCYNNCTFVHSGTICRNSSHADCDLPEYCSGISNQCPGDFFRKDSLPCNNATGVCVSGLCLDRSTQCQEYWGPSSRNGASICYLINTQGERYAHCGYTPPSTYAQCSFTDRECGLLHCMSNATTATLPGVSGLSFRFVVNGEACRSITITSSDTSDVGFVRNGMSCGTNKICMDRRCVSAANLGCDATCSNNGVCNNLLHCHCNIGWSPPFCNITGFGGSVDSGPASPITETIIEIEIEPVETTLELDMLLGVDITSFANPEDGPIFVENESAFSVQLKTLEPWILSQNRLLVENCWILDRSAQTSQMFVLRNGALVGGGTITSNNSQVMLTSKASISYNANVPTSFNVYCECVLCNDDIGNC